MPAIRLRATSGALNGIVDTNIQDAPSGGGAGVLNVAALPLANRQTSDWAAHRALLSSTPSGLGLPRGTVITDRLTGFPKLSLGRGQKDYSSSGPSISLADSSGNVRIVWRDNENGGVWACGTLTRHATTPTITNVVTLVTQPASETGVAWSQNASTPYYLYVITGAGVVHRLDMRTNTAAPGENFPKNVAASITASYTSAFGWLTLSDDDNTLCFQTSLAEVGGIWRRNADTVLWHDAAWFSAFLPSHFLFDEVHLSPSGRYVVILGGTSSGTLSEPMGWWDTVTDKRSANVLPNGTQMSHVAFGADDILYALNPSSSVLDMRQVGPVPITTDGQTVPAPTAYANTVLTSVEFQHTSAFLRLGGAASLDYTVGGPLSYRVGTVGTWTNVSGSVWQTTVDIGAYQSGLIGVRDVVERNSVEVQMRTLTRRADGVTDLAPNEWSVDAAVGGTQTLRVRMNDSGNPTNRINAWAPRLNHNMVGLLRNDGADVRVGATIDAWGASYYEFAFAQISREGGWLIYNTNHGIPGGRVDVMAAQLPLVGGG